MPTPAWWLSLMKTIVMWSLLTWSWPLQWSQYDAARSMLVDDVHGALEMLMTLMVPWWYGWWWWEMVELWWCNLEMPCWCLMSSQYSLMHVVGSHAIWCLGAMGLAHDGGVMIAWWWVSTMMEMTYIDDAMIHSHDGDDIHWCDAWWAYLSLGEFRPCLACWWGSLTPS